MNAGKRGVLVAIAFLAGFAALASPAAACKPSFLSSVEIDAAGWATGEAVTRRLSSMESLSARNRVQAIAATDLLERASEADIIARVEASSRFPSWSRSWMQRNCSVGVQIGNGGDSPLQCRAWLAKFRVLEVLRGTPQAFIEVNQIAGGKIEIWPPKRELLSSTATNGMFGGCFPEQMLLGQRFIALGSYYRGQVSWLFFGPFQEADHPAIVAARRVAMDERPRRH